MDLLFVSKMSDKCLLHVPRARHLLIVYSEGVKNPKKGFKLWSYIYRKHTEKLQMQELEAYYQKLLINQSSFLTLETAV